MLLRFIRGNIPLPMQINIMKLKFDSSSEIRRVQVGNRILDIIFNYGIHIYSLQSASVAKSFYQPAVFQLVLN